MKNLQLDYQQDFDYSRDEPVMAGNNHFGYYVFHGMTISGTFTVDGVRLNAQFETGNIDHDYSSPSNNFALNFKYSHPVLRILDDLYESDIISNNDDVLEQLEEIRSYIPTVDSIEKLHELYSFYNENRPINSLEYLEDGHSYNIDDYEKTDSLREPLTLKKD